MGKSKKLIVAFFLLMLLLGLGYYRKAHIHIIYYVASEYPNFAREWREEQSLKEWDACELRNGEWIPISWRGDKYQGLCHEAEPDKGKECYQNSDCVNKVCSPVKLSSRDSEMIYQINDEGYLLGECGFNYSVNRSIPFKTKTFSDLEFVMKDQF